jgi:hypothetical protein
MRDRPQARGGMVWNEDGTDATLAPDAGLTLPVTAAPGGRCRVPARADCLACHGGGAVLGLGALQLSPDRDPLAPTMEGLLPERAPAGRMRHRVDRRRRAWGLAGIIVRRPSRPRCWPAPARMPN